jgi:poly-beta-1,6-N-acetyl-D-glucosamine synthase
MIELFQILFWVCVAEVAYSYAGYPAVLALLARIFGRPAQSDPRFLPRVAFVVPAYNEEKVIRKKIENILSLDYPPELIRLYVGSDQSNDRTCEIVRGITDRRVRLWEAPRRGGKTAILNSLAPQVEAEIIIFTDANTMHRRESLAKMVAPFADPKVGAVAGQIIHAAEGSKEFEEKAYRRFEVFQKVQESKLHSTISCFGGFYAVRKSLFRPIRPNAYSNDDVLIPMDIIRQGFRVIFEPGSISYEDMTESLSSEYKRRIRIGAGNFQAFFWLLDFLNPLKGWSWFCYASHKVTRWFSPLCIAGGLLACWVLSEFYSLNPFRIFFSSAVVVIAAGVSSQVFPLRFTHRIFYFMSMNAPLLMGLFRCLGGIKTAAWERTERK